MFGQGHVGTMGKKAVTPCLLYRPTPFRDFRLDRNDLRQDIAPAWGDAVGGAAALHSSQAAKTIEAFLNPMLRQAQTRRQRGGSNARDAPQVSEHLRIG